MMKNNFMIRGGAGDLTQPNTAARPQDNLYLAVNSAWQKDAVIPADRTEIGVNTEIDMRIEKRMMADLDNLAAGKEALSEIQDLEKGVNL